MWQQILKVDNQTIYYIPKFCGSEVKLIFLRTLKESSKPSTVFHSSFLASRSIQKTLLRGGGFSIFIDEIWVAPCPMISKIWVTPPYIICLKPYMCDMVLSTLIWSLVLGEIWAPPCRDVYHIKRIRSYRYHNADTGIVSKWQITILLTMILINIELFWAKVNVF